MKRLNLRTPKPYNPKWTETENPRRKFYLLTEGATEESYFEGIRNNRRELEIDNDIHIEIVKKTKDNEHYSHPYQLVMAALTYLGRLDAEGNELPEEKWELNCKWDYEKDLDKVYLVFDRDYRKLDDWLDKIIELCRKHNIYIAMSTPNFELWLLLHFPDISQYDKHMLLENPKNRKNKIFAEASKDKKYLEILVAKAAGGYTKGRKLRFERFINGVSLAIEQEKLFSEDLEFLKSNAGSNVGLLLEDMKTK